MAARIKEESLVMQTLISYVIIIIVTECVFY
jgi:hypothetical protein